VRDPVLDMLRATVGLDRVLFGSDFPYIRRDLAVAGVGDLRRTAALDEAEYKAVLGGNALPLFPRARGASALEHVPLIPAHAGIQGQQALEFVAPGSPLSRGRAEMTSDSISPEYALTPSHRTRSMSVG